MEDRSESVQCCELSALLEVVRLVVEENQTLPPPSSTAPLDWALYEHQASPQPRHSHGTRGSRARRNSYHSSGHFMDLGPPLTSHGKASPAEGSQHAAERGGSSASRVIPGGPCYSCGITYAPQWRRPDGGAMLLCNRCGIHYTRYKTLPGPRKENQVSKATPPGSPAPGAASKRKAAPEQLIEDQDAPAEDDSYMTAAHASLARQQPPTLSSSAPLPQSPLEVVMLQKVCAKRHPSTTAVGAVAGLAPAARSQSHNGGPLTAPTSSDTSHGKDQDGTSVVVEQPHMGAGSSSASGRRHRSRRHSAASAVQLPFNDAGVQPGPSNAPVVSSASSRPQPQLHARPARQPHLAPSRLATPSFADEAHGHVPYPSPGFANLRGGCIGLPSSVPDMPGPTLQEQIWPQLLAAQSAPIPIPISSRYPAGSLPAAPFAVVHAQASGSSAEAGAAEVQLLARRTSRGPSTGSLHILSVPAASIPEVSRSSCSQISQAGSQTVGAQQPAGQQEQGEADTELETEPAGLSSADPDADADMAMMDM